MKIGFQIKEIIVRSQSVSGLMISIFFLKWSILFSNILQFTKEHSILQ